MADIERDKFTSENDSSCGRLKVKLYREEKAATAQGASQRGGGGVIYRPTRLFMGDKNPERRTSPTRQMCFECPVVLVRWYWH